MRSHPGFQLANYGSLGLKTPAAQSSFQEWQKLVQFEGAVPQYPFAAWGDFNRDGLLDVVLPFFGDRRVNDWGWREWLLVVFEGRANGTYVPVIAAKDTFGLCFDGMLFHPKRKRIEFWCGSGGGNFRWDGSKYVASAMKGD